MTSQDEHADERARLRRMRAVSLLEGSTLLLLVFVAVPLRHLAGMPIATRIMGPIHGLAFLLYVWMLLKTVSEGNWSRSETARLIIAAFVPFGAFVNERRLARRAASISIST